MIPDFVSHYYREVPLRSLSDLPAEGVNEVVAKLATTREIPFRLTQADYMRDRRAIEQRMRETLQAKGGKPQRKSPHYFVLGRSHIWGKMEPKVLEIPRAECSAEWTSFTYTDSYYTFQTQTLRGIRIPAQPHRGQLYRLDELHRVIDEFGLPPGYADHTEEFDVYIEVQIWSDHPLQHILSGFSDATDDHRDP